MKFCSDSLKCFNFYNSSSVKFLDTRPFIQQELPEKFFSLGVMLYGYTILKTVDI